MFGATNIVKVIKKSGYIVAMEQLFDRAGSWNFGNDLARNVLIFVIDKSSSSHADSL